MAFTTVQDWVDDTRDTLLSGHVEEIDVLVGDISAAAASLTIQYATPGVVAGSTIEIGSELMYVHAVASTTVTVARGYAGSAAASHTAGDLITVNPKFPTYRIINALNADLRDLSSPVTGLYQAKTETFTYQSNIAGYNLTNVTSINGVLSVTWEDESAYEGEPEIHSWRLLRNRDTDVFASGFALILNQGATSGQTVRVTYKAPFTEISSVSDALSTVGLLAEAYDVPPLGAAMALMAGAPIRREFIDEQFSSRRSEEVPPGAISASMRDLRLRRSDRVNAEAARLAQLYPVTHSRQTPGANVMGSGYGHTFG